MSSDEGAEIEVTIGAILADESGSPTGYWDPTIKMPEARSAVLTMTDTELHELSGRYMAADRIGTTAKEPEQSRVPEPTHRA